MIRVVARRPMRYVALCTTSMHAKNCIPLMGPMGDLWVGKHWKWSPGAHMCPNPLDPSVGSGSTLAHLLAGVQYRSGTDQDQPWNFPWYPSNLGVQGSQSPGDGVSSQPDGRDPNRTGEIPTRGAQPDGRDPNQPQSKSTIRYRWILNQLDLRRSP